jgi:hypothetical protein
MGPVKNPNLAKQNHRHSTAFALTDFRTQFSKQRFDVALLHVGAHRSGKDQF